MRVDRVCPISQQRLTWLRKLAVESTQACLEATGNYGEEMASYLHESGHTVSVVNLVRIKGFAQSELIQTKTTRLMPESSPVFAW